MVGILKDVSDRKSAEEELVRRTQELAESQAQYRTTGEAIPDGSGAGRRWTAARAGEPLLP